MRNPDFERESGLLSLSYDALFLPSGYPKKREGLAALSLIPGKNIEGGGLPASLGRLLWASWPLLRALCSFETLQAPLDVREAFLKPPEKVMELVLVAALVVSFVMALAVSLVVALVVSLVMALAVSLVVALVVSFVMALAVSLVMALGHFCFHVAKQFFGLFVFALFAQFIDFAFGLLDELTDFPVLFTFVAFALAIAFAVSLVMALAVSLVMAFPVAMVFSLVAFPVVMVFSLVAFPVAMVFSLVAFPVAMVFTLVAFPVAMVFTLVAFPVVVVFTLVALPVTTFSLAPVRGATPVLALPVTTFSLAPMRGPTSVLALPVTTFSLTPVRGSTPALALLVTTFALTGSSASVFTGPLARAFTGPSASVFTSPSASVFTSLGGAFGGTFAFSCTILLLSQGGQDEQADQGKDGQFGFHELEVVVDE